MSELIIGLSNLVIPLDPLNTTYKYRHLTFHWPIVHIAVISNALGHMYAVFCHQRKKIVTYYLNRPTSHLTWIGWYMAVPIQIKEYKATVLRFPTFEGIGNLILFNKFYLHVNIWTLPKAKVIQIFKKIISHGHLKCAC